MCLLVFPKRWRASKFFIYSSSFIFNITGVYIPTIANTLNYIIYKFVHKKCQLTFQKHIKFNFGNTLNNVMNFQCDTHKEYSNLNINILNTLGNY